MEELSEYSSQLVEFLPAKKTARQHQLVDNCCATDPPPPSRDAAVQTKRRCDAHTQTTTPSCLATLSSAEERNLSHWLQTICPIMEVELQQPTPQLDNDDPLLDLSEQLQIETYQKIALGAPVEHTQGMAVWLSLHTNDAPVLVVSATPTGTDDWSEAALQQCLKVYQPRRLEAGNYVAYAEVARMPVKLVKCLCTNPFNKSIFAGSTLDGDIYVWQYTAASSAIVELYSVNAPHGCAAAIDWATEQCLLSAHASGWIVQWKLAQSSSHLRQQWAYQLHPVGALITAATSGGNEISALVSLTASEFVVGTKDGGIYQCWHAGLATAAAKSQFEVVPLRRHRFMVATLLRARLGGLAVIISCDLSGELYYHDLRHSDEEDDPRTANLIAQIPLPFKNSVACSSDGRIIYAPGVDGALDCYRVQDGQYACIKGGLRGKGNFIKCSDNGRWIITGLYEDEFQLFYATEET